MKHRCRRVGSPDPSPTATPRSGTPPHRESDRPLLVTVLEAAELMSVGRTTIYQLLEEGHLPSVLIGKSRRIPISAIHQYVEQLTRPTIGDPEEGSGP